MTVFSARNFCRVATWEHFYIIIQNKDHHLGDIVAGADKPTNSVSVEKHAHPLKVVYCLYMLTLLASQTAGFLICIMP